MPCFSLILTASKKSKLDEIKGFVKNKVIVISMTNFDTVLSRFPSVAQDIFKELDNKSLIKCRKASFLWQNFIDNEKIIWIRQLQKYIGNMEEFYEQWKLVIRKTPVIIVNELSRAVVQFFEDKVSRIKRQYAPLHVAARQDLLGLSKSIIQKTGDRNATRSVTEIAPSSTCKN